MLTPAALAFVALPIAATPPAFVIEDLGTLGGELANAFALNDVGEVAGQAENENIVTNAFYWREGIGMVSTGTFIGVDSYSRANGLNDAGFVVGNAVDFVNPGYSPKAFIWHESTGLLDLGLDAWSTGTDVNNSNVVCGYASGASGVAFFWTAEAGATFFSLPGAPAGYSNEPTAINDNGVIAGWGWNANFDLMVYTYDTSTGVLTELPGLDDSNTCGDINNHGVVVGSSAEPNNLVHGCYWTAAGELRLIERLAEPHELVHGDARGVNDAGRIVGTDTSVQTPRISVGWLWIDGEKWALEDLIIGDDVGDWEIPHPFDINNANQIVGIGIHSGVPGSAFRMTPVDTCVSDLDGNGTTDAVDFLRLIADWGQPDSPADTNDDGTVDALDYLALIGGWGNCTSQPGGACCLPTGACVTLNQLRCQIADGTWSGPGSECAQAGCPQPNDGDLIENAIVIPSLPYAASGNTIGFGDDYDVWCPAFGSTSADIVYAFTPSADTTITVSMCAGSAYDTKVYIFEDDEHTLVDCNDDACTSPAMASPVVSEIVNAPLTAGHTYYIVVDGFGGDEGAFTLDVN